MKTIIVACKTLQEEVELANARTGVNCEVKYIESGLHERPKKLTETVQALLSSLQADRVLLCLGQCGNAIVGIRAAGFEMILPKVDDCLSLLIGSSKEKNRLSMKDKAFFLTKGWLSGESTVMSQYEHAIKRYGEKTARSILKMMYEHYETIGLIDTGTEPMNELYEQTESIASLLNLSRKTYPGTLSYIEQLLTGPWPADRFVTKRPFETVSAEDFTA